MKNAVVTGATGFIGRALVEKLSQEGIRFFIVARNLDKAKHIFENYSGITYLESDMENYDNLSLEEPLDDCVFYHLAWRGVYGLERSSDEIQIENIKGSIKASELAFRLGCQKFIGIGTIMEKEALACCEADGVKPNAGYIYGEAKHVAHLKTKIECAKMGLDHIWAMPTNVYGVGDDSTRLIKASLDKILNNEKLEFSEGSQLYDFIYIDDVARALYLLGLKGKPFTSYLLGSGEPRPLKEYLTILLKIADYEDCANFGAVSYSGASLSSEDFSADKLHRDTGFSCEIPFEEGIKITYNSMRDRQS